MNKLLNWVGGFLLGSVIGAGVVLLFLPRSGAETRQLIQGRVDAILEEGRQAAEVRHHELIARFEALKQPGPLE
jgi:gas vesicle protein